MHNRFHTLVIGGGCLGCATAFSLARCLGQGKDIAIVEKAVLGAGLSSRHSGIIRSANAVSKAARLAKYATEMWQDLPRYWRVSTPFEKPGAIWIAPPHGNRHSDKWSDLVQTMIQEGISFEPISPAEARQLSGDLLVTNADERYFYEPEVLQLDGLRLRRTFYEGVAKNAIALLEEHTVLGVKCSDKGLINEVITDKGVLECDFVVNAVGAWSPALFAPLGIQIPIGLDPVYAANWLVSPARLSKKFPIIADFVNLAYIRRWGHGEIHVHQPRLRSSTGLARIFAETSKKAYTADKIYAATATDFTDTVHSKRLAYSQILQRRLPSLNSKLFMNATVSYFDITPDLQFILGSDPSVPNLFHCLGGGQSLKYAPVFDELIAELIIKDKTSVSQLDVSEYSISRFANKPLSVFWESFKTGQNAL